MQLREFRSDVQSEQIADNPYRIFKMRVFKSEHCIYSSWIESVFNRMVLGKAVSSIGLQKKSFPDVANDGDQVTCHCKVVEEG